MQKRNRLEIIKDILQIIQKNHGEINLTPLLRRSNISSKRFYEYLKEINQKEFVKTKDNQKEKIIILTEKGKKYLEKYQTIINFIEEFEL